MRAFRVPAAGYLLQAKRAQIAATIHADIPLPLARPADIAFGQALGAHGIQALTFVAHQGVAALAVMVRFLLPIFIPVLFLLLSLL